jgi:hypothetical protein
MRAQVEQMPFQRCIREKGEASPVLSKNMTVSLPLAVVKAMGKARADTRRKDFIIVLHVAKESYRKKQVSGAE